MIELHGLVIAEHYPLVGTANDFNAYILSNAQEKKLDDFERNGGDSWEEIIRHIEENEYLKKIPVYDLMDFWIERHIAELRSWKEAA